MPNADNREVTDSEILIAITKLTEQMASHDQAGAARTIEVARRLDLINGSVKEHGDAISANREAITVLRNRWVMLGWVGGSGVIMGGLAVAVAELLLR